MQTIEIDNVWSNTLETEFSQIPDLLTDFQTLVRAQQVAYSTLLPIGRSTLEWFMYTVSVVRRAQPSAMRSSFYVVPRSLFGSWSNKSEATSLNDS